jgi:hypothetical protein
MQNLAEFFQVGFAQLAADVFHDAIDETIWMSKAFALYYLDFPFSYWCVVPFLDYYVPLHRISREGMEGLLILVVEKIIPNGINGAFPKSLLKAAHR